MLSRRGVIGAGLALGTIGLAGCSDKVNKVMGFASRMMEIEKRHGGRIGVAMTNGTDVASNANLSIQSTDRFAHCSVFKWVLAAAVLQAVDQGKLSLGQKVRFGKSDLLDYAPVTTKRVAEGGMALGDLCEAMVELSDNTAANLVLPLVGGPAGLTAFVRGLGDTVTRFDRNEPDLNTNADKDERDTSTPASMSGLLRTVYTGTVLRPDSLLQLKTWMIGCKTGDARIRAGVPKDWVVADKTGTGDNGAANDVAVLWPPNQPPLFLAIYTSGGTLDTDGRNKVIADVARLVIDTLTFAQTLDSGESSS